MLIADDTDLTIPAFLRRTAAEKRHTIRSQAHHYTSDPVRPEGARWVRAERYRVHLHDEAPRIGSGIRTCWVIVGRKRVGLCAGTTKQVIPRHVWNGALARSAIKLEEYRP